MLAVCTNMRALVCVPVHIRMRVRMRVCVYAYVCVCVSVCVCYYLAVEECFIWAINSFLRVDNGDPFDSASALHGQ